MQCLPMMTCWSTSSKTAAPRNVGAPGTGCVAMRRILILPIICAALAVALAGVRPAWAEPSAKKQFAAAGKKLLGCWGDADKGDSAELKLYFLRDGSMIQYDENQVENKKRTFGAWEMAKESTFLSIYWPSGNIARYTIKRIGPILHFSGLNGVNSFTLHKLLLERCWQPKV